MNDPSSRAQSILTDWEALLALSPSSNTIRESLRAAYDIGFAEGKVQGGKIMGDSMMAAITKKAAS